MLTTVELINMGILMGIVHVLTGPDHLSAMATLSVINILARDTNAFTLGMKWGIGHSIGLLIAGGLLIAADDQQQQQASEWIGMNASWGYIFEWVVGLFMLALGMYGVHSAFRNRFATEDRDRRRKRPPMDFVEMPTQQSEAVGTLDDSNKSSVVLRMEDVLAVDKDGATEVIDRLIDQAGIAVDNIQRLVEDTDDDDRLSYDVSNRHSDEEELYEQCKHSLKSSGSGLSKSIKRILTKETSSSPAVAPMKAKSFIQKHATPENSIVSHSASHRSHESYLYACYHCALCDKTSTWAIVAGIVHGVAGPGGVLGVIPAVQLRDAKMSTIYLSMFCITSTLVMGGFAAFYRTFSEWLAGRHRVFFVEAGSACLSISVGMVWILLLSVGKMEDAFP